LILFDAGEHHTGHIDIRPKKECHICKEKTRVLIVDSSGCEYDTAPLCMRCITDLFEKGEQTGLFDDEDMGELT